MLVTMSPGKRMPWGTTRLRTSSPRFLAAGEKKKSSSSVPITTQSETTPGADDNASAVAVLIEVARRMRHLHPARTMRFVGFACEEPPHFHTGDMGSQVYARQCRSEGRHPRNALPGNGRLLFDEPNSQKIPPWIPKFLRRVSEARQFSRRRRKPAFQALAVAVSSRIQTGCAFSIIFACLAGIDFRNSPLGQQLVLGPGLPGPNAHRHELPAKSALSSIERHTRDTRLRTNGTSHNGRRWRSVQSRLRK